MINTGESMIGDEMELGISHALTENKSRSQMPIVCSYVPTCCLHKIGPIILREEETPKLRGPRSARSYSSFIYLLRRLLLSQWLHHILSRHHSLAHMPQINYQLPFPARFPTFQQVHISVGNPIFDFLY
uniref:Uncharacterized protein n=1 Tax=Oryza brachyantha TaxID=4533 RepID=J3LGA1_ORYBR